MTHPLECQACAVADDQVGTALGIAMLDLEMHSKSMNDEGIFDPRVVKVWLQEIASQEIMGLLMEEKERYYPDDEF